MRKLISITLIGFFTLGLFSFIRNSKKEGNKQDSPILGMILLEEPNSMQIEKVVSELRKHWKLKVDDSEIGKESSVLVIDGYNIAIAEIPAAIPGNEVQTTAEYNYLWENGVKESSKHKSHVILSIMNSGKNPISENLLFNKVAASILKHSESLGVYIGGRTLLIKKDFYLENTKMMSEEDLPLYNWVYFGLRQENGKQSIYTYGLADFGKPEMEIVNSSDSFDDLNEIMFNMVHYVIASNVTLRDGETIGMSATQKLKIIESKGQFLDGRTLKIEY